jgi:NADPH:quinone reductase-like Zn-dependent oxidoreductase
MRGYVTDPNASGGLRFADDLPEPMPGDDEVVIEVGAFSVNRGELALLQVRTDGWRPGQDLAGTVVRAAADGRGPAEGTRVIAIAEGAGWSERIALPTNVVAPLPDGVDVEVAASLPIAGLTALRALRVDGPVLGRRVLVTGATGGVGHLAVQLAVAAGAEVTAQVSSTAREPQARDLGAHHVVTDLDDERLDPFDLVLDGVGGALLRGAVHRLAPGGTVATYGTLGGPAELGMLDFGSAPLGKVVGFFHAHPQQTRGEDLATLVGFVAEDRLRPLLGATEDWTRLRDVLDAMRAREIRGKAVLRVG